MKKEKKDPETLDSYLANENPHWSAYAYKLHGKAVESGLFEKTETPVQVVSNSVELLRTQLDAPAKAVEEVLALTAKAELTAPQQLFVLKGLDGYLEITEFDEGDFATVQELLQSHAKRLYREVNPPKPLVKNIREQLKELVQTELKTLPNTLKDLEPEKRLAILCKLLPFALPKVDSIAADSWEPGHNPFG